MHFVFLTPQRERGGEVKHDGSLGKEKAGQLIKVKEIMTVSTTCHKHFIHCLKKTHKVDDIMK